MTDTTGHDPDCTCREIDPKLLELCARALALAERGERRRAAKVVQRISAQYPRRGIVIACLSWCDALIEHVPGLAHNADRPIGLVFENAESGERGDVDHVPPPVRWAGRLLAARARFDADTCRALINSQEAGYDFGDCVLALLDMAALGRTRNATYVMPDPKLRPGAGQ